MRGLAWGKKYSYFLYKKRAESYLAKNNILILQILYYFILFTKGLIIGIYAEDREPKKANAKPTAISSNLKKENEDLKEKEAFLIEEIANLQIHVKNYLNW